MYFGIVSACASLKGGTRLKLCTVKAIALWLRRGYCVAGVGGAGHIVAAAAAALAIATAAAVVQPAGSAAVTVVAVAGAIAITAMPGVAVMLLSYIEPLVLLPLKLMRSG